MIHDVNRIEKIGNTMVQDVNIDITVTQADLGPLYWTGRLSNYAVVVRTVRNQLGGGFGDQNKYPYAWVVLVYVDGQTAQVMSARGTVREWLNLDRLERWLREQGFRYWWVQNDLEPIGLEAAESALPPEPPLGYK